MMRLAMKRVEGAAAAGAADSLLVMTYNVLAQCYVRSSFFPYCNGAALRWKNRSKKLEEVFSGLPVQPDVICLQEVDNVDEFWGPMMERQGFTGLFVKKSSTKKDGVAMFWNEKRVALVKQEPVALDDPVGDESDCSEDLLSRSKRGSVALLARFKRQEDPSSEFVVATTHLFWDPLQEDVKLLQSRRLLHHLEEFARDPQLMCTVLAGDFNSLPDSKVYEFIRSHGNFGSAYAHYRRATDAADSELTEPEFTNVNGAKTYPDGREIASFVGTLDYIFYRSDSRLQPSALMEIMSYEAATKEVALPSTFSPSDHLPLLCTFAIKPSRD